MAGISGTGGGRAVAETRAAHLSETEQARLSREVLTRQLGLSVRVAVVFSLLLFGLPILNWLAPGAMGVNVGGFPLTWLLLAVLFYPLTWLLSGYFIRASDQIEHQLAIEKRDEIERDEAPASERSADR